VEDDDARHPEQRALVDALGWHFGYDSVCSMCLEHLANALSTAQEREV
jgi:hypothetical protein